MKRRIMSRLALLGVAAAIMPLLAHPHHSGAAYDGDSVKRIVGHVTRWQFANPHSSLQIRVSDEDGEEQLWDFESLPAGMLAPRGYRRNTFEPNDEITVVYNPMRNGGVGGRLVGAILEDGITIGEVPSE